MAGAKAGACNSSRLKGAVGPNGATYVWGWVWEEAGGSWLKGQRDFVLAVAGAFPHGHTGPCGRW